MSSYVRRLISRGIVDIAKSHIKYKLPNEEKIVKDVYQRITMISRVPTKSSYGMDQPRFRLHNKNLHDRNRNLISNPDTLQNILSEDFYRYVGGRQLQDFTDGLVTGFSHSNFTREGEKTEMIGLTVNEVEFRKIALNQVLRERENYGYTSVRDDGNKRTVFIECPSGSLLSLGPFHRFDLYSAIIANAVGNIYEAAGYKVIKCHYICDSRSAFACLYQGLKEKGNIDQFERSPVSQFYDISQQMISACRTNEMKKRNVDELRKKILNEDKSVMADVKKIRDIISTENKKTFERLGIQFTHTEWESEYYRQRRSGTFQTNRGYSLLIPETGVIALEDRYEKYQFDKIVYCGFNTFRNIGNYLQNKHGWKLDSPLFDFVQEGKVEASYVNFELEIVEEHSKTTEECLNDAKQQVIDALRSQGDSENIENIEEVAEVIGNTCVIIQTILSTYNKYQYRGTYETIENGMFLQYVHARLSQLLSLNADVNIDELLEVSDDIIRCLEEPEACRLILHMCQYEEQFEAAIFKRQPVFIVKQLLELASGINHCLDTLTVKNQPDDIVFARLVLFTCAKIVFSNGIRLMGIKPLDKSWD